MMLSRMQSFFFLQCLTSSHALLSDPAGEITHKLSLAPHEPERKLGNGCSSQKNAIMPDENIAGSDKADETGLGELTEQMAPLDLQGNGAEANSETMRQTLQQVVSVATNGTTRAHAEELVEKLGEMSADLISKPDRYDLTPLMKALYYENFEVAHVLLDNGAEANPKTTNPDHAPIQLVALWGTRAIAEKLVEILVKKRADVNSPRDSDGRTPLMKALQRENFNVALVLLDNGAEVTTAPDNSGQTAWNYAIDHATTIPDDVQKSLHAAIRKEVFEVLEGRRAYTELPEELSKIIADMFSFIP